MLIGTTNKRRNVALFCCGRGLHPTSTDMSDREVRRSVIEQAPHPPHQSVIVDPDAVEQDSAISRALADEERAGEGEVWGGGRVSSCQWQSLGSIVFALTQGEMTHILNQCGFLASNFRGAPSLRAIFEFYYNFSVMCSTQTAPPLSLSLPAERKMEQQLQHCAHIQEL
jgi:hypothetical protein